jgi:anti-sigma regulatory factor (Ser/Thr protein kinase)
MPTPQRAEMTPGNGSGGPDGFSDVVAIALPADLDAPGAARRVINTCVGPLVPPPVLADAVLLASELVSNGVLHAGLDERDTLQIRVRLSESTLRLEVENPGVGGQVAAREPDAPTPTGFGLDLTALLSTRWGVERGNDTSVWAELTRI